MNKTKECNCDEGFLCKCCEAEQEALMDEMYREYRLYGVKDESGKTVDVREVQFMEDSNGNIKTT